ncbi:MAG TPA: MFS transporter [Caulobacteraceae bacterium]|jgi:MFS family permease|nr:MFS transporter [Caulobacteraceae bacterium]
MTASPVSADHPTITSGQVTAAVMGNALEFYDFTTYTIFAVDIGKAFFPSHSPFVSLMASLGTFGAGFLTRPVGAVVIGAIADRIGRRPAMLLSFALMGVAILGLSLTPSFAQIGLAAPIVVVLFRLIQGFALGGEVGPATAFLIEAAPLNQRGLFGSWQSASQSASSLVGGAVGAVMAAMLAPHLLEAYGWRAAFLIGALVLPFGLIIRRGLPETLHRPDAAARAYDQSPGGMMAHAPILLFGLASILSFTTSTYVRLYMTTYAITTLHMPAAAAYGASVVNGAAGVIFTVLGGWLSDKYGRKPLMIIPLIAYLIVIYPAFWLIVRNHDAITLWTATGAISALGSMSTGAALIVLAEGLRKELRSTGMGTVYAVAVALFGGMTQPLIAYVIHTTGNAMAPAFYLMATTVVGIVAMVLVRETAPHLAPQLA